MSNPPVDFYLDEPSTRRPKIPPDVNSSINPVSEVLRSDLIIWALAASTTPNLNRTSDYLWDNYATFANGSYHTRCLDTDIARRDIIYNAVSTKDIIVITGGHGVGKTTLIPVLAKKAAEYNKQGDFNNDPKSSEKFIIIVYNETAAVTLRDHLRSVYTDVNINLYFDLAGTSLCHQTRNGSTTQDDNFSLTKTLETKGFSFSNPKYEMPNIDGCIVDPPTGLQMIERGFIGTVFIENGENFHNNSMYTTILSRAVKMMAYSNIPKVPSGHVIGKERRLGRLVILTTDSNEPFLHACDVSKERRLLFIDELRLNKCTVHWGNPDVRMRNRNDAPTFTSSALMDQPSITPTDIMLDVQTSTQFVQYVSTRNRGVFNIGAILGMESQPQNGLPNTHFTSFVLARVLESTIRHSLKEDFHSYNSIRRNARDILVLCISKENVAALSSMVQNMESFKVTAQKDVTDKMYRTSKITYEWKADLTSLRPQTQNVLINQEVLNSILKPNPGKNNSTIVKGRIIFTTGCVGDTLECTNLAAVVVAVQRVNPGCYHSTGLEAPTTEFIDNWEIRQAMRRGGIRGDKRMITFNRSIKMTCFLREFCAELPMRGPSFFNPTAKTALLEDAEICGFTTPAPGFPQGNPVIQQDFRRLLDLFDGIDPQTAALLVIGVRMKLARQVVALAAMEKTGWRVCQQAGSNNKNVHPSFELPLHSQFQAAVRMMNHSSGNSLSTHPGYDSHIIAAADLWASYYCAIQLKISELEMSYGTMRSRIQNNSINVPDTNFWSGSWSGASAGYWNRMGDAYANRMNLPVNFSKLTEVIIKDEGRESFEAATREICRILYAAGITKTLDIICGPLSGEYNKYTFTDESPLLRDFGVDLLSGLITMCSSNFGRNRGIRTRKLKDEEGQTVGERPLPPRYEVHVLKKLPHQEYDKTFVVHGYGTDQERNWRRKFATYLRSDANPDPRRDDDVKDPAPSTRFHSLVHPVTLGHIAIFANIFGKSKLGPVTHNENVFKKYHQLLMNTYLEKKTPFSQRELITPDNFGSAQELKLTGSPRDNKKLVIGMSSEAAHHIGNGRAYLSSILNDALSGGPMDNYANYIGEMWIYYNTY